MTYPPPYWQASIALALVLLGLVLVFCAGALYALDRIGTATAPPAADLADDTD